MELQRLKHYHIVILHRLHDIGVTIFLGAYVRYKNSTMVNLIEGGTTLLFSTFAQNQ